LGWRWFCCVADPVEERLSLNQRNLLILVGALALVALAVLLLDRGGQRQLDEGDLLLPGLSESLNDVSEVVLRRSGNAVMVTLAQTADGWVVSDRGNYPANFSRLRQNLRGLAEARIFESKTSNPEFYERLGVRDINDSLATGTEFTITSPTVSAQVIVGRTDEGGGKLAYVRKTGEEQSYLVKASLDPGQGPNDWLDSALLDIPSTRIRSAQIRHPDGEILAVAKPRSDSVNYTVADIPAGRSLSYEGAANSIGAALAGLTLDDVEPTGDFEPGEVQPVLASFETFDGLRVDVQTWELADGERRVAFAATAQAPAEVAAPAETEAAEAGPVDAAEVARIADEAADITKRLGRWIYTVPSFKSDQFTRRMNDLLAAPE
jgi:hypothetical protein